MNKSQLVDALADRLGDRRTAATAVDALLQIVVDTVRSGDSVSLTGFGVFESRARAARTGRNPRTGETVDVPATTVPAFRPGTGFRTAVAGDDAPPPRPPSAARSAAAPGGTGGAGAAPEGSVINGAVDVAPPDLATALTDLPPPADTAKKGKAKKAGKAEKAEQPEKPEKSDKPEKKAPAGKKATPAADKDGKKGRKGKK